MRDSRKAHTALPCKGDRIIAAEEDAVALQMSRYVGLSGDLGYASDLHYRPLYNMQVEPAWNWRHKAPGFDAPLHTANVALDLAAAMRSNPQLNVFSMNGLFDLATPFFGTEFDLSHMLLSTDLQRNLRFSYYESGHMTYGDQKALQLMKRDLGLYYDETLR